MTKVYWSVVGKQTLHTAPSNAWMHILHQPPEPILKAILAERTRQAYFNCPAFIDMCKNTYLLRAPVDMYIDIDRANRSIIIRNQGQDFFNEFMADRFDNSADTDPYILTTPPSYIFYAKTSVRMELLPPFLMHSPVQDNLKLIPGAFDIGKWVRPTEFSAEVTDDTKPIIIRENDPLIAVRFTPEDGSKVELERVELTPEILSATRSCLQIKKVKQNVKLPQLYEYAKEYLSFVFKRHKE